MNTLLWRSRVIILFVLAPALLGETEARERGQRAESSRPLMESRQIVGVVPAKDHIDVFWLHENEFVVPLRSTLYRTRVSADGGSRLSTTRIFQFEDSVSVRVSGSGGNIQVLWNGGSQIMVSPLDGETLKYSSGKPVAFGLYADLRCHDTECVAIYDVSSVQMAAILDTDSNVVSGPFALPSGLHPLAVRFSEAGIFFLRHTQSHLRAALVHRDGSIRYDVGLASAEPLAFHTTQPGVAPNGAGYLVAFGEFAPTPDELHAVTVGSDGKLSAPTRLLETEEHRDLPNNIGGLSLASNGSGFVLAGSYVIGRSFLVRLDSAMQRQGAVVRDDAIPSVHPHQNGSDFVVVWHAAFPYLTILREDGSSTEPLSLVAPSRRRSVR